MAGGVRNHLKKENHYGEKAYPIVKAYLQDVRKGVADHPSRQATMLVNRWKFCTVDNELKNSLRKKFKPLSMQELRER